MQPREAINFFLQLSPPFETELETEDTETINLHGIVRIFAEYFAANQGSFSDKQLRRFGEWINSGIAAGGDMENAISTCMLEHAEKLKINRTLAPYLSKTSKLKMRA